MTFIRYNDCLSLLTAMVVIFTAAVSISAADIQCPESHRLLVGTVVDTIRILRDDPVPGNLPVTLWSARNEWESFQILVRSDVPVQGVTVSMSEMNGPDGAVIPAENARIYRIHQLRIDEGSWRNDDFVVGWYPDALIPYEHPLTHEPPVPVEDTVLTEKAFSLSPDRTHGFLVDVFVPPGIPPGSYSGMARVQARGNSSPLIPVDIPVTVNVWDFDLPDVPALDTLFWAPEELMRHYCWLLGETHDESYWSDVVFQCNELVSRHGINPTMKAYSLYYTVQPDGSFQMAPSQIAQIQSYLDAFPMNACRIPFRGCPRIKEVVFGSPAYDENTFDISQFDDEKREKLINYMQHWDTVLDQLNGADSMEFVIYLCDEPNTYQAYEYVRALGTAIRSADLSHLKVLVVEQTVPDVPEWGNLYGAVDIWCPHFCSFDPVMAAYRQSLGEQVWIYTALASCDNVPYWLTDFPLISYRIPAWIAWRYRLSGLLYWAMSNWPMGEDQLNPWRRAWYDPLTYVVEWAGNTYYYNGDGLLVYPARYLGFEGITPSLRLKALRDSIEDYEYLACLDQMGLSQDAEAIVFPVASSWTDFESDPAAYEAARFALAQLILSVPHRDRILMDCP